MERRKFLKNTAAIAMGSMVPQYQHELIGKGMKKVGVQLFSLPKLLEKDFSAAVKMLAQMGYKEVELYGPFPFSVDAVKENWKALAPMLGFKGSGYFGHSPKEVKAILGEFGIKATATHADLETLDTRMQELGVAGDELGFKYVGLPAIPEEKRKTLDDYKKIADQFNKIGEEAKKVGLKFAYHNHGYGLKEREGQIPMKIILDQTDPDLVFFEMDIYWTVAGGADPISYLQDYPNRYRLMHLKNMKEKVHFSGGGDNPAEWIELFPYMTTAGEGVLDIASIIPVAKKAGVKHFFVEQDMVEQPEIALKKSIDYLKSL